ncbi:hypothetical protein GGF32_008614 [Allomyces javanicus]|nr:hypothetical protein GGF32_008614 [Allomyces javanicus]
MTKTMGHRFTGQAPPSDFAVVNNLIAASKQFQDTICRIPTKHNQMATFTSSADRAIIAHAAKTTRILVSSRTITLIDAFLARKCREGSPAERELYKSMDCAVFIQRLIKCRPLIFINSDDTTTTRENVDLYDSTKIWKSAENRPAELPLSGYLTYDEMAISALLGVSTPTLFINDGNRRNCGRKGEPGTFERFGIYLAVVGSRFEVRDEMESRVMYGTVERPPPTKAELEPEWATFYDAEDKDRKVITLWDEGTPDEPVFDETRYRRRMRTTFDLILAECVARSIEYGMPAYLRQVGLGLSCWQVHKAKQTDMYITEFIAALEASSCTPDQLACVDWTWIPKPTDVDVPSTVTTRCGATVEVRFSHDNPATLLPEPYRGKCLLVGTYAWDSNAFPGNEFWMGAREASGDPAAACCSLIPELQNPYINTGFLDRIVVHGDDK